jgi:hypothetical protein
LRIDNADPSLTTAPTNSGSLSDLIWAGHQLQACLLLASILSSSPGRHGLRQNAAALASFGAVVAGMKRDGTLAELPKN